MAISTFRASLLKGFLGYFFLLCGSSISHGQTPVNVYDRCSTSLEGYWKYIVDPYENGFYNYRLEAFDEQDNPSKNAFFTDSKPADRSELLEYDFDLSDSIYVPGDWNSQKEKLFYYEGTVWYRRHFDYTKQDSSNRVFLYFGAVNNRCHVYLNGIKIGQHTGGFTPFSFEVTALLKDTGNSLVVKVDNKRIKEGVPTLNTDWWNYGGITREVSLVETPETYVEDYSVHLARDKPGTLQGSVLLNGSLKAGRQVQVRIPELQKSIQVLTDDKGMASFSLPVDTLRLWSDQDPKRYKVILSTGQDSVSEWIGFRNISVKGRDILLNGRPVFLKGISIHEESPVRKGRAHTREDARILLGWARELGCNFVRLAHYPHNEHMVRLADSLGMLVWEEIPVYWTIAWENPSTYNNAAKQLNEVIRRDKNRASVIIWSMANETPTSPTRTQFLTDLATLTRSLDPTRLISAALEQSALNGNPKIRTIEDNFARVVDILSFNQYIGWYDGLPDKAREISWKIEQEKPVFISEFGGGAKQGLHGDKYTRWTEEYQEFLYEENLKMLSGIEQLRGMSPWILVDFRSPRRMLPEIQDGWNRKGLISEEGIKKKAFYSLQKYYLTKE
ncbi:beta-glucuronidase [Muriicola jejuensis]|uniref:Beta-glucuronidase n=1 Tax=Muriicola jejuensis TaxID=504488 RepID=A0A6P0UII3_9FLAO|nr:glycoside hydrolase family 2 TIM barrel-domain containing protein [Muriicola jejuensis]NER11688.1 beta-glucuronidase [Muriicola jejuensis]SMP25433.1 beta-glucuronidase [Muriicola jejuensis]